MSTVMRRVVRRETHSPRSTATVIVLVGLSLIAAYTATEVVLHLAQVPPLLASPGVILASISQAPADAAQLTVAIGVFAALVGILLVLAAVAPGRRAVHELETTGYDVIVDNGVIASALAESVRREFDLRDDGVTVGVGHRRVDVQVRPEPGHELAAPQVTAHAETVLARYHLQPSPRVRTRIRSRHEEDFG